MKARLFSDSPPSGRALLLAKALEESTYLAFLECINLAMALFASKFDRSNPAEVSIRDEESHARLKKLCDEVGIQMLGENSFGP